MLLSQEWTGKLASDLYQTSNILGECINKITDGIRSRSQAIIDESTACDIIFLSGKEMIKALREVATRLDRAVCIKIIK